ncbi:hypothetical protein LguiB_027152 [Lonicera macranthoides]
MKKRCLEDLSPEDRNDIEMRDQIFTEVIGEDGRGHALCMGVVSPRSRLGPEQQIPKAPRLLSMSPPSGKWLRDMVLQMPNNEALARAYAAMEVERRKQMMNSGVRRMI